MNPKLLRKILEETPFRPLALIEALKEEPVLAEVYPLSVGVTLHCSLERHTLSVMATYERYFASRPLPGGFDRSLFRLLLALHDIGKPRAVVEGDKKLQLGYTTAMIDAFRQRLPFDNAAIDCACAVVDGDPFGTYLRGFDPLDEAERQVRKMATAARIAPAVFFDLLTIYYQSDISAYMTPAGVLSVLDPLFVWKTHGDEAAFDDSTGRIHFSPEFTAPFAALEHRIKNNAAR